MELSLYNRETNFFGAKWEIIAVIKVYRIWNVCFFSTKKDWVVEKRLYVEQEIEMILIRAVGITTRGMHMEVINYMFMKPLTYKKGPKAI